jgi:cell division protein FtsB
MMQSSLIKDGQRKRKYRWMALAAFTLLSFLVNEVVGQNGYVARREQTLQIQELTHEIDLMKQENRYLSERIQSLRSDPGAIEEMAREQLHLGKPGEVVVTLSPRPSAKH